MNANTPTDDGDAPSVRPNNVINEIGTPPPRELAQERNPILAHLPHLSTELLVLMIKRLEAWKALVSFLMSQADNIKSSEKHCVSIIAKSAKVSKQESGTVASMFPDSSKIALLPTTVVGSIDRAVSQLEVYIASIRTQILPNLKAMRGEVSDRIAHLTAMSKESTKEFQKEVKRASELMEKLDSLLTLSSHDAHDSGKDPWMVSLTLSKSFSRSQDKYNLSLEKVNAAKASLMAWEEGISYRIESNITLLLSGAKGNQDKTREEISSLIKISPQEEWKIFEDLCQDKCTVLDNSKELFSVPRNELNTPLMKGRLRYLSSVLKKWKECYVVLTPIGWLHQFSDEPDITNVEQETPKRSIWLKSCTLSPLHIPGQHHDELAITRCDKAGLGTSKSSTVRYTSVNNANLKPWWDAVSTLTRINLRAEENTGHSATTDRLDSPTINTSTQRIRSSISNDSTKDKSELSSKDPLSGKTLDTQNSALKTENLSSTQENAPVTPDISKTPSEMKNIFNIDTSGIETLQKKAGGTSTSQKHHSHRSSHHTHSSRDNSHKTSQSKDSA